MRNYAKFCKINVNNTKYQLNLTEAGQDDAHFFNKFVSVASYIAPGYMLFSLGQNLFLNSMSLVFSTDLITKLVAAGIVFFTFCLPITNVGKGYNSILRGLILKRKTKNYYSKMRKLEYNKNNINEKTNTDKQIKLTNKFIGLLKRVTSYNDLLARKYQRKISKKGYVDGTNAFANDNIESVQEAVDKFIFHNRDFLYNYCPKHQKFIKNRMMTHYSIIKNDGNYYDEYYWSATHKNDMLVKNDCIFNHETTDYFERLRKLFNVKIEEEKNNIKPQDYKTNENKIQQAQKPKFYTDIYKEQTYENLKN